MIRPVCCIRDQLAGFMSPFCVNNEKLAERDFKILINDPNNAMYHNPAHFDLYKIGVFDDETGIITSSEPTIVATGLSLYKGALDV